jgi:hypothetical protein
MPALPSFLPPIEKARGLRPEAWLVVGRGFSREDLKAELLRERGIVGSAVLSLESIALKIVPHATERMLSALARQDALRMLMGVEAIAQHLPELKRLKRQSTFFRRLDTAIQNGRSAFAHAEEAEVVFARLDQALGESPVRREVGILARAYEGWMEGMQLWDPPRLYAEAVRVLENDFEACARARFPKEIWHYSISQPEGLEQSLWDALGRNCSLVAVGRAPASGEKTPLADEGPDQGEGSPRKIDWQRWHTIDDAAESLAERLAGAPTCDIEDSVVLIPDGTDVRRSLKRALDRHGVALADPRDPTRLKWDERLKWAMLPIEVVARGFERVVTLSYLRSFAPSPLYPNWVEEIHSRGLRAGLRSYRGGVLSEAYDRLLKLDQAFGGKKQATELATAHQEWLTSEQAPAWVVSFVAQVWEELIRDQRLLGRDARRAPTLYWWERFRERVSQAPAPVERERPEVGLRSYRAHQLPVHSSKRVYVLGLPSQWLSLETPGDYWLGARERDLLSAEFAVRASFQARSERVAAFRAWLESASEVVFLDAEYEPSGSERDSLESLFRELELELGVKFPETPDSRGAHPRWLASFSAIRSLAPREVLLSGRTLDAASLPELSATAIEHYSRCGFIALGMSRWKLRDAREPSAELWPDVRGQILHEATRILVASRDAEGGFRLSIDESIDQAWKKVPPRGLLQGKRAEHYVRSRLKKVLEAFAKKEQEYVRKTGAKVLSLEEEGSFKLSLPAESPEFVIKGTPDRIDELSEGLWVMDYKTSSAPAPHGSEMLELGYRLQMPIYALATAQKTGKPVIGVQFVELNRKAGRSSGIFFKAYNGKEPGKPTQVRSNSKSLLSVTPAEAWQALGEQILAHGRAYLRGEFKALPKRKRKECDPCRLRDLCGDRRVIVDESTEGGDSSEAGGSGG